MQPLFPLLSSREQKPAFDRLPPDVLRAVEKLLGSAVTDGVTAFGGYSASASFILTLQDGRTVFAKGSHPQERAHGARNLRQEVESYRSIGLLARLAPEFLGYLALGDDDGWHLGFWCGIDTKPLPLNGDFFIAALEEISHERGAGAVSCKESPYFTHIFSDEKKWHRIAGEEKIAQNFLSLFEDTGLAKTWLDENLDTLCALQTRAAQTDFAQGLMHGDLRCDNFLYDGAKTFVIDWANACTGPLVFDAVTLGADLERLGMMHAEEAWHGDRDAYVCMAVLFAGYLADQAYRDIPAAMPRLRDLQKGQLCALLLSLGRLGIIDSPPRFSGQNPPA